MRVRIGVSCATITWTCAGLALAPLGACVSDDNASPPAGADASFPDVGAPDTGPIPIVDATSPKDTNAPDTIQPTPDSAIPDAGCQPTSTAAFVPSAYVSIAGRPFNFPCIQQPYAAAITADCFSDAASYAACNGSFDVGDGGTQGTDCLSCLVGPESSDAGYGPVVQGLVPIVNLAGCLELHDPGDAGFACAARVQAAWQCAEFACRTSCPAVTDDATRAEVIACMKAATTGTACSAYAQGAALCAAAERDAATNGVDLDCFDPDGGDPTLTLLDYFCGT